jgi:hypothetical protein
MKWIIVVGLLVPAVLFSQAAKKGSTGPNRYNFIHEQGGKEKFVFDNNTGDLWKLVTDSKGEPLLKQVLKEDASIKQLKEEKIAMKEEKTLFEKKYKLEVLRGDSLKAALEKMKAKMETLSKKATGETSASIKKVWKSKFYQNASAPHKGIIDSLMVNNNYKLTKKGLKGLKAKIKEKEAKGVNQTTEKNIIAIIEKYYQFKE